MKRALLIAMILLPLAVFAFDRSIRAELGGFSAGRLAFEAVAEEPPFGWEWIELRQRYSLAGTGLVRNYDDGHGWYYSGAVLATLGRVDIAGGALGIDGIAGLHYSRIEGAYRFADFAFGVRASSNITFWLERELVRGEFAYLAGNLFDVMWGTLALSPMKNFAIGAGFHRDGELTEWGKPLPYQSPEDWPDKWDGGVNYFIFVGYSLEL